MDARGGTRWLVCFSDFHRHRPVASVLLLDELVCVVWTPLAKEPEEQYVAEYLSV